MDANAPVAQWIEHQIPVLRVGGSSPFRRAISGSGGLTIHSSARLLFMPEKTRMMRLYFLLSPVFRYNHSRGIPQIRTRRKKIMRKCIRTAAALLLALALAAGLFGCSIPAPIVSGGDKPHTTEPAATGSQTDTEDTQTWKMQKTPVSRTGPAKRIPPIRRPWRRTRLCGRGRKP